MLLKSQKRGKILKQGLHLSHFIREARSHFIREALRHFREALSHFIREALSHFIREALSHFIREALSHIQKGQCRGPTVALAKPFGKCTKFFFIICSLVFEIDLNS